MMLSWRNSVGPVHSTLVKTVIRMQHCFRIHFQDRSLPVRIKSVLITEVWSSTTVKKLEKQKKKTGRIPETQNVCHYTWVFLSLFFRRWFPSKFEKTNLSDASKVLSIVLKIKINNALSVFLKNLQIYRRSKQLIRNKVLGIVSRKMYTV